MRVSGDGGSVPRLRGIQVEEILSYEYNREPESALKGGRPECATLTNTLSVQEQV